MQYIDDREAQDRRLKLLLDMSNTIITNKNNQVENDLRRQQLANQAYQVSLQDPSKNKYLRSELATQNRLRLAQANNLNEKDSQKPAQESPFRMNARDKRTEDLLSTVNNNAVTRSMITDARESVKRLSSGVYGKVTRDFAKNLSADSPALRDYQVVKSVLTDAQLRESMFLKGAISDTENKWLAAASANDELLSSPRAGVIFDKMMKKMDAEENAKIDTYKRAYGEDPSTWEEIKNVRSKDQVKKMSVETGLPEEILASIPGLKSIKKVEKAK